MAAARKRSREAVAPDPQPNRLPGMSDSELRIAEKFISRNWNGEDPTSRVSPRAKALDDLLFHGATLLDDCARSSNQRYLILCFRLTIRDTFQAFQLAMMKSTVVDDAHFEFWRVYVYTVGETKQKNSQVFWELNFYQDRQEEHTRLKQSLMHPSPHYTFDALQNSWVGERSLMGHFGVLHDLVHDPITKDSSIFGITRAL